jgi:hypothetical protein
MHTREEIEQACFLWKEWFSGSVDNREFHLISADGPQDSRTSLGELDWYNRIGLIAITHNLLKQVEEKNRLLQKESHPKEKPVEIYRYISAGLLVKKGLWRKPQFILLFFLRTIRNRDSLRLLSG